MRILYFYPSNKSAVGFDTIWTELGRRGHDILLLTTCEPGALHADAEQLGVAARSTGIRRRSTAGYYLRQIAALVQFVRTHDIDVVFSHLQHANFIAVLAQPFLRAPVVAFRHHFKFLAGHPDIPLEKNRNEALFDMVINALAKRIVVPSIGVYRGMADHERVNMSKVRRIPYMYDFSRYPDPAPERVEELKARFPARLRLLMCSRLIPFKRHRMAFEVVRELVEEGLDLRMLVLDEGPVRPALDAFVTEHGLGGHIEMLGYRTDVLDIMAASDLLLHPSLTEASNSAVKEMALLGRTAAVCRGVGDFDEYVRDGENGFLLSPTETAGDLADVIRTVYQSPELLDRLGSRLRQDVLARFSVNDSTLALYDELLNP